MIKNISGRFGIILGALLTAACALRAASAEGRPNIVLILADDLGYGDVGFHGSKQIPTPNLDQLAASGVRCTQGYVSSAVCSPSRAGILTGRNQVEFGYDNNLDENETAPGFDGNYAGLPLTERTIADRLRTAGYVTGAIGKWHLGSKPQFHPLRRGFDEFWGFLGGGHRYLPGSADKIESEIECSFGPTRPITYLTDDITDQSIDFMRRHKERPFFLYVAYNAPHAPLQARDEDLARFAFINDQKRRTYCAMVARLDFQIGRLLESVREQNLSERTLIVFLSDNGGPVDQNASLNAPLNGEKGTLFEGGIRVPFVFNWPGHLPAGRTYEPVISSLDLAPTFLRLASADQAQFAGLEGIDVLPRISGAISASPHQELLWRFTISAAIRDGDWKLVRLPDRLPLLFNLRDDLSEQHDVLQENLARGKDMLARLGAWDVALPHPVTVEGAVWKRRQLNLYDAKYPLIQPAGGEAPRFVSEKETTAPH